MRNNIILFRSVTIIYIYYFYLIGVRVIPNLAIIAIVSLYLYALSLQAFYSSYNYYSSF
jgi:hypothetical protein